MTINTADKILDDIASTHELDDDQAIRLAEVQVAAAAARSAEKRAAAETAKSAALNRLAEAAEDVVDEFQKLGPIAAAAGHALKAALNAWEQHNRPTRPQFPGSHHGYTPRGE
jgi:hypothetical protein